MLSKLTPQHPPTIVECIAQQPKSILLVHHWDTDGLASAALMQLYILKKSPSTVVTLFHPTINLYFLTKEQYAWIDQQQPEVIVCVDLNFPLEVFIKLKQLAPQLFVFDHHVQTAKFHLPGAQNASYPGASQLIADQLLLPTSLVSVCGMVGDQEDAIMRWEKFTPIVDQILKEHLLTLEQLIHLTKLLDAMYIVGDDKGLAYAITLLQRNPLEAFTDQRFLQAEQRIAKDKEQELAKKMEDLSCGTQTKIYLQEITATSNIISELTRIRAKQFPNDVIISTHHITSEYANVYVRTRRLDMDLTPIVIRARTVGLNAGGKKEVAGVIVPQAKLEEYLDGLIGEVMKLLPN